jgi:Spy/CpxP family protein refolding chaperone
MKAKSWFLLAAAVFLASSLAAAASNKGAAHFVINAGSMPGISFPHRLHQDNNPDCQVCHRLFPEQIGALNRLKQEKTLKRMQVMNTVCIACHRQNRAAGKEAGPVICRGCHTQS